MEKKRLLKTLVGCSVKYFKGETIEEMLENLKNMPESEYNGQSNYSAMRKRLEALEEVIRMAKIEESCVEEGQGFTSASQIYSYFKVDLEKEQQEYFYAVILDNKHRIIETKLITLGTLNKSLVHPREVFAPAIEKRASAIIAVHNHPSGDPKPSKNDVDTTKRLQEAGEIVGIRILDHVIVGRGRFFSFADHDLM